jgi:quinol monooxygenase YgiN
MKPVTVVNRIMLRPGKIDEFIEEQRKCVVTLPPCGLIGGRMYRSVDEQSAVSVSVFESKSAVDSVFQRADFRENIQRLRPLVESSSPILCAEAYTYGTYR